MAKSNRLYKVLGIGRGASSDEVKAAHRRRAKETHPDTGGDKDEFQQVQTAYLVLSNPKRRAKYDDDGTIDDPVDNELVGPLNVINMLLQQFLSEALKQPVQASGDIFCPHNVPDVIKGEIKKQIAQAEQHIIDQGEVIKRLARLVKRFKAKKDKTPYLKRMVEDSITNVKTEIRNTQRSIEAATKALELLDGQEFDFDKAAQESERGTFMMIGGNVVRVG